MEGNNLKEQRPVITVDGERVYTRLQMRERYGFADDVALWRRVQDGSIPKIKVCGATFYLDAVKGYGERL